MPDFIGEAIDRVAVDIRAGMVADDAQGSAALLLGLPERLRGLRARLVTTFGEAYEQALARSFADESVARPAEGAAGTEAGMLTGRLKLVDDDSLQDILLAAEMVRQIQNALEREMDQRAEVYWGMRLRLAQICGTTDYSEEANLFGIRGAIDALVSAAANCINDHKVRRALLRAMRGCLTEAILECYREINEFLVREQVLPGIVSAIHYLVSHGKQLSSHFSGLDEREISSSDTVNRLLQSLLRQESNPLARQWASALGNATNQSMGMNGAGAMVAPASRTGPGADHAASGGLAGLPGFQRVQSGVAGQGAGEFTSGGIPLIAGGLPDAAAGFGADASIDGTLRAAMMDFLARAARGPKEDRQFIAQMLSEPREHLFDSALEMPPSPGLLRVLGERQRAAAEADSEIGFGYDEALKAQAHPLDALTADFVESVFESVTAESAISAAARAEIARLQPAALKAAVLDRTFFASRVHPMRRLLDRMTQAARDPGIDSSDGSEFVRELHDMVSSLNETFSDDLRTVEAMIDRVDDLADRYAGTARNEEAIDTRVLERSERELVAAALTSAELERRIPSSTPPFIQDFLRRWWRRALIESHVGEKTGEASWTHRLDTIDQLIWSVSAGFAQEVTRLRRILPLLVRTLILGARDAGMPDAHRDAFLDALMNLHRRIIAHWRDAVEAAAPSPTMVGTATAGIDAGADADLSLHPTGEAESPLATRMAVPPEVPPAETAMPADADADRYSKAYCERLADSLTEGSIVEFISSDVAGNAIWQPLRLSWVSPQRMIFLFTARLTRARQMNRPALVEGLENGTARLVEEGSSYLDRTIAAVAGT